MATVAGLLALLIVLILAARIMLDRHHPRSAPFPVLWAAPPILVIGLSVLIGAARYPTLPARIPAHFDAAGTADLFVATTPVTALFLVVVQVLLTAMLTGAGTLVLRTPYPQQASAPAGPDPAEVRWRAYAAVLTTRSLLMLAAALDLALLLIALSVWRGETALPGRTMTFAALSVAAGLIAVLVAGVRAARADRNGGTGHWRGAFYVNRSDPKLFVPKRAGVGWTVNLGRPAGWALVAGLIGVPLLTAVVGHWA